MTETVETYKPLTAIVMIIKIGIVDHMPKQGDVRVRLDTQITNQDYNINFRKPPLDCFQLLVESLLVLCTRHLR